MHGCVLHFVFHKGQVLHLVQRNTFSDHFFPVNMYQEPAAVWHLSFGLKTGEGSPGAIKRSQNQTSSFCGNLVSYILSCLFNLCKHLSLNKQLRPRLIVGSEPVSCPVLPRLGSPAHEVTANIMLRYAAFKLISPLWSADVFLLLLDVPIGYL